VNLLRKLHAACSFILYGEQFAIVPSKINAKWPQRKFLRHLLLSLDVDCVLDVGANTGQYATELRLIGYRGLIISFEPSVGCFVQLERAAKADPKWVVVNCALGSHSGEGLLNEMTTSQFNSFYTPSLDETEYHKQYNIVARTTAVKIDTLDKALTELQARHGFRRPFLKMDTQGYDLEVFRGGQKVHNTLVGLQSEVPFKRIYEGAPRWEEAIAEYETAGFELVGLYKVNPHEIQLIECDCYMLRSGLMP
jgi:FkbM family methyltransferase